MRDWVVLGETTRHVLRREKGFIPWLGWQAFLADRPVIAAKHCNISVASHDPCLDRQAIRVGNVISILDRNQPALGPAPAYVQSSSTADTTSIYQP